MSPAVQVHNSATGLCTYSVDVPPEALPPVASRDIERAWHAARQAAIAERWGPPRGFRFRRGDEGAVDRWQVLALADPDARCWADAVDATVGMASAYGLSLCLRLLALVDLLGRVGWAGRVVRLARDGAELHPALLVAAATVRLTAEAGFDESLFRDHLGRDLVPPPFPASPPIQAPPDRSHTMILAPRVAAAIALLALAGCSTSLPPLSQASFAAGPPADSTPAANAACRERANESFERGERSSAIETGRDPVDSPFSSVPMKEGIHGLATQSSFNQSYADCLRARSPAQAVRPGAAATRP